MLAPVWTDPRYRHFFRGAVRLVERLATREGRGDHACLARLVILAVSGAPDESPHDDFEASCTPPANTGPTALQTARSRVS